jgi:formylglycine-generating enzyme required for sulfatase activity
MVCLKSVLRLVFVAALCAAPVLAAPRKKAKSSSAPPPKSTTTPETLRPAIEDLAATFGSRYAGKTYLNRLAALEGSGKTSGSEFQALSREALLANPLLDFDRVLLVKRNFGKSARSVISKSLGMPSLNSHVHNTIPAGKWDNEIVVLSDLRGSGKLNTLFKPAGKSAICETEPGYDAKRLMFSMRGAHGRWALFEMPLDGSARAVQISPTDLQDVDVFDSCYLPNGKIITTSTASMQGLPCENGSKPMACLYELDPRSKRMRQLTFEQDSDWCPTMMPNGRVLYQRWEYTDTPHYFTRVLMTMNPDGTGQMAIYGSNGYWPNSYFFARPVPASSHLVGIVGGHHGISRSGGFVILDPKKGHTEADGVVQQIPFRNKTVEPLIIDRLVDNTWPQFLHPFPLSENYHLVVAKPSRSALWGLYLVDVFDNMTLIKEIEGAALLEPIPLRPRPRPPVIPERVRPGAKTANVVVADVYYGPGLKGMPRGTVKKLRILAYHYAYQGTGGHFSVGWESGWDIKRILGTVPVEADGSANFLVPANTPISLQPLDEKGRAVQLMRSWMVGMPGEQVSCSGCHEPPSQTAPAKSTPSAFKRAPSPIDPPAEGVRPFAFQYDVQPVLDQYCMGCHKERFGPPDAALVTQLPTKFHYEPFVKDAGYMSLALYIRRPGAESDYHLTVPMEYHASTSKLVQMLEKGHNGVKLDDVAWTRINRWIDLNVPYRGKWGPENWDSKLPERRRELAMQYGGICSNPESEYDRAMREWQERRASIKFVAPPEPEAATAPTVPGWPFGADKAKTLQGDNAEIRIPLGKCQTRNVIFNNRVTTYDAENITLVFKRVPAGTFVMGDADGYPDEKPHVITIDKPFWMAETEISNGAYNLYDSKHDSRYIDNAGKDQSTRGVPVNANAQPVTRIGWNNAMGFCEWLSRKTGKTVTLPTEAQWEWACRAGSGAAMWFGATDSEFGKYENLSDAAAQKARGRGKKGGLTPFAVVSAVNDGAAVIAPVGRYEANPFGLKDMHGNVAEWTRSLYRPYPYKGDDGREDDGTAGERVVRGGSWRDKPNWASSFVRRRYQAWQRTPNVGFRVVLLEE